MHNTRSALASLINRYKAVLKKCHLLNTFGSLALATVFSLGGVELACADTGMSAAYEGTLTDSAYSALELTGDVKDYYANFIIYSELSSSADNTDVYTLEKTQYGVLLNNTYATGSDIANASDSNIIIVSYFNNYVSDNDTIIDTSNDVYTISYTDKNGASKTISFDATNGTNKANVRESYVSSTTNTVDTTENITDRTNNYVGCENKDDKTGFPYAQYSGGAISIVNDQKHGAVGVTTTVTLDTISGDFIGNSITSVNETIYQGNGGAIGLFSNHDAELLVTNITGDFIGNSASRVGGALYLFTNNDAITNVTSISGDFIANIAGLGGGAIANYEGTIECVDSDFIGNVAIEGGGGAIDNMMWSKIGGHTATIGDVTGVFIANSTGSVTTGGSVTSTTIGNGGAIRNFAYSYSEDAKTSGHAAIGDITAHFIGNEAIGDGGALYNYAHSYEDNQEVQNTASVASIRGDFIGNSASGSGGAIYNDDNYNSTASIGSITGDFINNTSGVFGGAIYNTSVIGYVISQDDGGNVVTSSEAVTAIKGNFIKNTINGATVAIGGAIYNNANGEDAFIGNITGDFIENSANATLGLGGAIANYAGSVGAEAKIGDITGDFIGNTATRYGGAIYNDSNELTNATIGNITGDFLYNSVTESITYQATPRAQGGAIYNNDTIGAISGSFIGNYAEAVTDKAEMNGGAIYTTAHMEFIADDKTQYFSDNYSKKFNGTVDHNAIYVDIDNIIQGEKQDIPLNFIMSGSGNVVMNDSISGNTEYTPRTNTDYSTIVKDDGSFDEVSASTTPIGGDTKVTINHGKYGESLTDTSITGTPKPTNKITTTTVTSVAGDITTTTTTVATTTYEDGVADTPTYSSTITKNDGNTIVSVETSTQNETGVAPVDTTTTTYTVTDAHGKTATYTETTEGGMTTVTSAQIVDGKTTTTYLYNGTDDESVLVSVAGETTKMTGETAYTIGITGESKENIFYLNDEVTNFGEFSITNATLYLSAYTHTNGVKTVGSLTALDSKSSVTFGKDSQLIIDMSAYPDAMSDGGAIGEAVLQGNGARLAIDQSSKLRLENAHSGDTFTILSGFNAKDEKGNVTIQGTEGHYAAWTIDNVTIDSDLLTVTIIRDGYDDTKDEVVDDSTVAALTAGGDTANDVYYVLSVAKDDDSPLLDTSTGDIVDDATDDNLFGSDSSIAGERYYYDISTIPDEHDEKTAAEGTANMAKVSGVPSTTYRVNRLSSDALSSRGDFGSGGNESGLAKLSKKYESTALWFVPMYGHDVTDGASVAGYDADFHTNIYGGVVGIDKTIDNDGANALGADLYRVGVALNMGVGDTSASGNFSNVSSDFNFGGAFVYGVAKYGDLTLRADAGFNKIFSEMHQDLSEHGIAGTEADVQSHAWSLDLNGEYRIATDMVDISPYVGLELVSMKTEDYAVKRSDAAGGTLYNITSGRQNIISVPVGVKFDTEWTTQNNWTFTPQLSLGAIFAMGDLDEHSSITMPEIAGSGYTSIQVVDEITFDMAVGLAFSNETWHFGLDYELQKSEHRTGHGLVGLIQYTF